MVLYDYQDRRIIAETTKVVNRSSLVFRVTVGKKGKIPTERKRPGRLAKTEIVMHGVHDLQSTTVCIDTRGTA
jgi:hypothetical protein